MRTRIPRLRPRRHNASDASWPPAHYSSYLPNVRLSGPLRAPATVFFILNFITIPSDKFLGRAARARARASPYTTHFYTNSNNLRSVWSPDMQIRTDGQIINRTDRSSVGTHFTMQIRPTVPEYRPVTAPELNQSIPRGGRQTPIRNT